MATTERKASIGSDNTQGVLLGILLTMLKLTGVITWPWWVVLLPVYGPYALGLVLALTLTVYIWWVKASDRRARRR